MSREEVWIQLSPPGCGAPDVEVVRLQTEDLAKTLKLFATSNHPWAIRFRDLHNKAFGIDWSPPPPPLNEKIVNCSEK